MSSPKSWPSQSADSSKPRPSQRKRAKGLQDFVATLQEMADEMAALNGAGDDDRELLRKETSALQECVDGLLTIITAHDALQIQQCDLPRKYLVDIGPFDPGGVTLLWNALASAFHIGGRVIDNPIVARLTANAKRASAAHARAKKADVSRRIAETISELALPIISDHPHRSSHRIANEILHNVNHQLAAMEIQELGADAVRKRVAALRTVGQ